MHVGQSTNFRMEMHRDIIGKSRLYEQRQLGATGRTIGDLFAELIEHSTLPGRYSWLEEWVRPLQLFPHFCKEV